MVGGIPFFCSELSRGAGEGAQGTASAGDVWLLVEYASVWHPKALEQSVLAPAVKSHLQRLLRAVPRSRLLFIKQGRRCADHLTVFVVHSRETAPTAARFHLSSYDELLDFDAERLASAETAPGAEAVSEPVFLVCTHGRRDKCCAKFGWPLYKALSGGPGGDAVWQSSHVGGDRFAANLVCFPHGVFYARVDEESGRRMMAEYREGRLVTEGYRGRACYGHGVQAAEFYVRREAGLLGLEELRLLDVSRVGAEAQRVRFASGGGAVVHTAVVGRRESAYRTFVTCHADEPKTVAQYTLEEYRAAAAEARPRAGV